MSYLRSRAGLAGSQGSTIGVVAKLGEADVRRLLEVVAAIEYDVANDALNPEPLVLLADMLDASTVGYLAFDGQSHAASVDVCAERQPYIGRCDEIEQVLFANPWPFKRAPGPGVRLLEDVTTRSAFHGTALFNEVIRVVHDEPMAEIYCRALDTVVIASSCSAASTTRAASSASTNGGSSSSSHRTSPARSSRLRRGGAVRPASA